MNKKGFYVENQCKKRKKGKSRKKPTDVVEDQGPVLITNKCFDGILIKI